MSADRAATAPSPAPAEPPAPAPPTGLTGRRRWVIPALLLLVWLVIGGVGGPYSGKLSEVTKNDSSSYLPKTAESNQVAALQTRFATSQTYPAFVLMESDSALTKAQLGAFAQFAQGIPKVAIPVAGGAPVTVGDFLAAGPVPVVPSQDGKAALALVNFDTKNLGATLKDGKSPIQRAIEEIRTADASVATNGARVYVAGPAGVIADLVKAFGGIDGILLLVAGLTVLVILLIVYRSPIVPFFVLGSAGFALTLSSLAVYFLAKNDVLTLDGQGQGILSILVIGAATDYALLLVARYREELRRHDSRFEAMWLAWRRAAEPIVASGATVIIGLLCLLLSDLGPTKGLGPVGAIGIAAAMLTALTFLPALLVLANAVAVAVGVLAFAGGAALAGSAFGASGSQVGVRIGIGVVLWVVAGLIGWGMLRGRRHRQRAEAGGAVAAEAGRWPFWPAVPHVGSEGPETKGIWARVARLVGAHPRRAWIGSAIVLLALASFLPTLKASGIKQSDTFLTTVESVTGGNELAKHFPAGSGSPTIVIGPATKAEAIKAAVTSAKGVSSAAFVTDATASGAPDPAAPPKVAAGSVELQVTLSDPADSPAADDTVRALRTSLDRVGTDVLVGGSTATNLDVRDIASADRNKIIPVVLAVIFVVLALLLRALIAPLILLVANVLSFAATLGASALVFNHVFRFPGSDPTVSLYGFVFLVALGIDYSIFLMTRVREESIRRGTRPGILMGLSVTGGVITSAGVVLAATFAALGVLPLLFLAQIAFIVAFGVLLDTLVVRSLLVPSIAYELGRRTWLPSRLGKEDGGRPSDA